MDSLEGEDCRFCPKSDTGRKKGSTCGLRNILEGQGEGLDVVREDSQKWCDRCRRSQDRQASGHGQEGAIPTGENDEDAAEGAQSRAVDRVSASSRVPFWWLLAGRSGCPGGLNRIRGAQLGALAAMGSLKGEGCRFCVASSDSARKDKRKLNLRNVPEGQGEGLDVVREDSKQWCDRCRRKQGRPEPRQGQEEAIPTDENDEEAAEGAQSPAVDRVSASSRVPFKHLNDQEQVQRFAAVADDRNKLAKQAKAKQARVCEGAASTAQQG
eukprot:CAMPEP_0172010070 /NCGR_PEP_ID=MMETSP1041-20130122/7533_1 /TAXON_ID=464988 /ORGANISM="Hemiselmis andersenii, Strain CCMP439" /LENGTH=268 /DNA_ID=CAMNT_0012664405 /DNA_START=8 /DNA_END=811 /DNA_ORIENTATION=-